MIQGCRKYGFALEVRQYFRIAGKGIGQKLDGDLAIEGFVVSQEKYGQQNLRIIGFGLDEIC
jgi:hypothetical protein